MDPLAEALGDYAGGRVLDVGTGAGPFALELAKALGSYEEILGIDFVERARAAFEKATAERRNLRFELMDASAMTFPDASFDTVAVSNSLHHFPDPEAVLREMVRVLKPGGRFILAEMHRDTAEPARLSHVRLHHWWAAVDRAGGIYHGETYSRDYLAGRAAAHGLEAAEAKDILEGGDPRDPETLRFIEGIMESYFGKAAALADGEGLAARGRELSAWLEAEGFLPAPGILLLARKPAAPGRGSEGQSR